MEELFTNATIEKSYFSNYEAVKTIIEKNAVDLMLLLMLLIISCKLFKKFKRERRD